MKKILHLIKIQGGIAVKKLTEQIDMLMEETVQIRRRIHQNPELGMKEFETTALIQKTLCECGIEIEDWGMNTGVSAIIYGGKSGKTIALRADIIKVMLSKRYYRISVHHLFFLLSLQTKT